MVRSCPSFERVRAPKLTLFPSSQSYAKIATLPLEYGLYSSFVGVCVYALFATSKDVTIGPVAVMSLEVARVIQHVQDSEGGAIYSAPEIATCLAFLCGLIVLGIGLLRLGWLIEVRSPSLDSAFPSLDRPTDAALSPAVHPLAVHRRLHDGLGAQHRGGPGPRPHGLLEQAQHARGDVQGHHQHAQALARHQARRCVRSLGPLVPLCVAPPLSESGLDVAELTSSSSLPSDLARWSLTRLERRARNPIVKKIAFFALTLRTAFVIIFLTVFSWVYVRGKSKPFPISILGDVPSGFQHMGQPKLPTELMSKIAPQLPVSTIILLLEHIAIAKSFGRVNNYKIDPNQELIAIGVSNLVGTLFNAYPATGSFSRSAIKAKAGVRTPLAGMFTGVCVVVALYALTGAFYWIPNSALAAVISASSSPSRPSFSLDALEADPPLLPPLLPPPPPPPPPTVHAVLDLIASPRQVYAFWKVSPLEALIFVIAVVVAVFSTVEISIYTSVGCSVALLLFRIARPRGSFLGRVRLRPDVAARPPSPTDKDNGGSGSVSPVSPPVLHRDVYLPLLPDGVRNPLVQVEAPPPGVLVYKFEESFLFPNASFCASSLSRSLLSFLAPLFAPPRAPPRRARRAALEPPS